MPRDLASARRQAMQKAQADAEYRPFEIGHVHNLTMEGIAATAAKHVINPLLRLFQRPVDNTARDIALSRIVTTPGEARNAMLARLLRAQNAADANAALSAPVERGVTAAGAGQPRRPRCRPAGTASGRAGSPMTGNADRRRSMPLPDLDTETYAVLAELQALDPAEAIILANAMMGAAMCFLTQFAGHDHGTSALDALLSAGTIDARQHAAGVAYAVL